jgi:Flp pilus assembly protein TadD
MVASLGRLAALFVVTIALSTHVQASKSTTVPQFVGSSSCSECHQQEHTDWLSSHHYAAMDKATGSSVLGRFDGATFSKGGVESRFFKKDDKFWVRTDGPDGKLADFEIKYVIGIAPLQQYLIELTRGRVQALGIAWDSRPASQGGQRWFDLYPDRKLVAGDPLHWTGVDQNWNYQCAWCHATNLRKNYDADSGGFRTSWSEFNVGCEACHGPASNHINWAKNPETRVSGDEKARGFAWSFDERRGVTWPMGDAGQAVRSTPRSTGKEIQICAGCHSRRQQFSDDPSDVAHYFDAFRPSLLESGLFHVDGQQRDEVYNYASFLQSKMHAAGVTCSDCHNSHSGKLRLSGNATCTQCHAAGRFDQASHHHHRPESEGASCANCHMPPTTYMGVDARHDHSMRIPRPDRSLTLGVPSACNSCHADKNPGWAAETIKSWFTTPKAGAQNFAEALDLDDRDAPGARRALMKIAADESQSAVGRASALARLARYATAEVLGLAERSSKDSDAMVRVAAIAALSSADPRARRNVLSPLLRDETRLVRIDAARALAGAAELGLPPDDRERFEKALAEYVSAQLFNAERPESHANLGALYQARGKVDDARVEYIKAFAIDPTFFPAAIAYSEATRASGDEAGAESILRRSLAANSNSGSLMHALGLSLIRQKRLDEAIESLTSAAKLDPNEPRFAYVLAVALHDTGKASQAIDALKTALARHPYNRDILIALASYEAEVNDFKSASSRAELLKKLEPENKEIEEYAATLKNLAK